MIFITPIRVFMNIIFFLPALLTLPLELVWNLPFMFFQQILMYAFVGGIYAFLYYEDTAR